MLLSWLLLSHFNIKDVQFFLCACFVFCLRSNHIGISTLSCLTTSTSGNKDSQRITSSTEIPLNFSSCQSKYICPIMSHHVPSCPTIEQLVLQCPVNVPHLSHVCPILFFMLKTFEVTVFISSFVYFLV